MTLARNELQSVNLGGVLYSVDRNWAAWPADLESGFLSTLAVGADDRDKRVDLIVVDDAAPHRWWCLNPTAASPAPGATT